MTMATKNEIFTRYLGEYLKAEKPRKTEILDIVCAVTGMHRKAATRKFRALQMRDPAKRERRGRREYYGPDVIAALREVWEADGEVCGELLHPMVSEYVEILTRDGMWAHGEETTRKLRAMSLGTMKRRVRRFLKAGRAKKGLSATKPSALKRIIPIFTGPWDGKPPGYGQIDTVVHCGDTLLGDYVYTLNYTDAATMLVIPRAQWNKGQEATQRSMAAVQKRMPFLWRGAHPDTGSEFINHFVVDWCGREGIELSRSRPGKKNDNMYVEERNGHVVRKYIGYWRLDCVEAVDALNAVYDVLTPYLMHFVAVRRTLSKEKLQSKYRRTYEKNPRTPYRRILEHPAVEEVVKTRLKDEHAHLNPLVLKREIEKRLQTLYDVQKRCGNPNSQSSLR
mgnify:CR=1 FL=1